MKAHIGFIHRKWAAFNQAVSDFIMGLIALVLALGMLGFGLGAVVLLFMFDLPNAICSGLIAFVLLGIFQWLQTRR